ncbi:Endothelial cell-specific molecule 1 [Branchiostoma belcheri]|nr:Endothelial cell-specific molecule 1 [Branchiostoma belcheri]
MLSKSSVESLPSLSAQIDSKYDLRNGKLLLQVASEYHSPTAKLSLGKYISHTHHYLGRMRNTDPMHQNIPVGDVVANIKSALLNEGNRSVSFAIVDGDPYGRFSVHADGSLGTLRVANPLDFGVPFQPTYAVKINIIDVDGYPPVYNTTCEAPEREGGPQRLFNLSNVISKFETGWIHTSDLQFLTSELRKELVMRVDNEVCGVTVVAGLKSLSDIGWANIYSSTGATLNCSSSQSGMTVQLRLVSRTNPIGEFQDLRDNHLINAEWLNDVRFGYFWVFQIDSYRTVSAATIRCKSTPIHFKITEQTTTYSIQFTIDKLGCARGKFGPWCDQDCVCKNHARCHGFNGACLCPVGWIGVACDIPTPAVALVTVPSQNIYIGSNVTLSCAAVHFNVSSMSLTYRPFYTNTSTVLSNQTTSIEFTMNAFRDDYNGVYRCVAETAGARDVVVGKELILNVTSCPPNLHGRFCHHTCGCKNGGRCDRWRGCVCRPGWRGEHCDRPCDHGHYGLNCQSVCACQGRGTCHHIDGTCFCQAPWHGPDCSRLMPGLEGQHLQLLGILGSFSHVVLAQLRTPGKEPVLVAAKSTCLADGRDGSERCYRDFYREVDILISLHNQSEHREGDNRRVHPNIVQLHGIITHSRPRRILLEYAPRGELLHFLRESRQDPDTSLSDLLPFALHVSRALRELETLKIVHRDVAARNVLITEDGVAKLADFGLARDVYASTVYVHTARRGQDDLLPLKWMALESLRDGVFTSRSDAWSFGVLLWEIATFGQEPRYPRVPYRPDCGQLIHILTDTPAASGTRLEWPAGCPVSLYRLMCQCWAAEPEDRPDGKQLEQRLEESINDN